MDWKQKTFMVACRVRVLKMRADRWREHCMYCLLLGVNPPDFEKWRAREMRLGGGGK